MDEPKKFNHKKEVKANEAFVTALEGMAEGKSLSKSLIDKGLKPYTELNKKILEPMQNNALHEALENKGVTVAYVAEKLKECMEAEDVKIEVKTGEVIRTPNERIRLQAIQMYTHICGYLASAEKKKEGDKHVHLHGKSTEELDELLRAAQTRKD